MFKKLILNFYFIKALISIHAQVNEKYFYYLKKIK